jgi:cell division protein ZipA
MLTYLLLFCLITIVILGVVRASKQKQPGAPRRSKEPFMSMAQHDDGSDKMDEVGEPRIIRRAPKPVLNVAAEDSTAEAEFVKASEEVLPEPQTVIEAAPLFAAAPKQPVADKCALEVIVLNIIANPEHPYQGYELLQAMLAVGLRYGKWGIFHRHQELTGRGPILFSLASSVEPGTFDLAKMGSFSTPGLTLFMRIANLENPSLALEKLLAAAQQLVEELSGTVCDEKRYPLAVEKIALWREQVAVMA